MRKGQPISGFWLLVAFAALSLSVVHSSGRGQKIEILLTSEERHLADLINQTRLEKGLVALELDSALTETARTHSKEMIDLDYLSTISPTRGTPLDRTQRAWISDYKSLAFVVKGQSVDEIHRILSRGDEFKSAILDRESTHLGVGIGGTDGAQLIATLHFIGRVIDFNQTMGEAVMIAGEDKASYSETHSGRSRKKFLKFEVYEGTDLADQSKRQFSQELTTKPDGTFSITFESYRDNDYYLAVWAKGEKDEEYELTNLIRVSPISPTLPRTEGRPTGPPTVKFPKREER